MKVYLYISDDAAVYLSGIIDSQHNFTSDDIVIFYSNQPINGTDFMVSMTLDQFVYLQDQGILQKQELLIN